jgi:hypothetical protein
LSKSAWQGAFVALAYGTFTRNLECSGTSESDRFRRAANLCTGDVIKKAFEVDNSEILTFEVWSKCRYVGSLREGSKRHVGMPMAEDCFFK